MIGKIEEGEKDVTISIKERTGLQQKKKIGISAAALFLSERKAEYDENGSLVSGGGTNLQAIIDAIESGKITNAEISVVISNNANAYALERAKQHGIEALCVSPKSFSSRKNLTRSFWRRSGRIRLDLVVLAGCLVVIPEIMVKAYPNKIINIHPALIPSFCGTGYYGLKFMKAC